MSSRRIKASIFERIAYGPPAPEGGGGTQPRSNLPSSQETEINLPFITADANWTMKHLVVKARPARNSSSWIDDLIKRSIEPCKKALSTPAVSAGDINGSRSRRRHDSYAESQFRPSKTFFGKEPHRGVNPDEVVAIGAAIQGGVLKAK